MQHMSLDQMRDANAHTTRNDLKKIQTPNFDGNETAGFQRLLQSCVPCFLNIANLKTIFWNT